MQRNLAELSAEVRGGWRQRGKEVDKEPTVKAGSCTHSGIHPPILSHSHFTLNTTTVQALHHASHLAKLLGAYTPTPNTTMATTGIATAAPLALCERAPLMTTTASTNLQPPVLPATRRPRHQSLPRRPL